jgi:DNA-binding PadR family transcriptional regulator
MHLGLAELVVLAVVDERPTHGFAIASLTARSGELGRIWHVPRPVVYRAIYRPVESELIRPEAVESDAGPQRTVYAATAEGRRRAGAWLESPVEHVREMRSQFLVKLALLHRHRGDRAVLLDRQREVLTGIADALQRERAASDDFDAVLLDWRRATTAAAVSFVERLAGTGTAAEAPVEPPRRA